MKMEEQIRVLIVDDHPMARQGIREILKTDAVFNIVGEAETGEETIELVADLMPDLILMDIHLPGMSGLEVTHYIKSHYPYVKIVVVTVSDDFTHLFEAIKNGAQGYLLKTVHNETWVNYLKAVAKDQAPISKRLAEQMLREFTSHQERCDVEGDQLSKREREILTWVAQGYTNKDIAIGLEISEYTVKNHLKNLFQKLHLNNRVQLAKYAYEKGYVKGAD